MREGNIRIFGQVEGNLPASCAAFLQQRFANRPVRGEADDPYSIELKRQDLTN